MHTGKRNREEKPAASEHAEPSGSENSLKRRIYSTRSRTKIDETNALGPKDSKGSTSQHEIEIDGGSAFPDSERNKSAQPSYHFSLNSSAASDFRNQDIIFKHCILGGMKDVDITEIKRGPVKGNGDGRKNVFHEPFSLEENFISEIVIRRILPRLTEGPNKVWV